LLTLQDVDILDRCKGFLAGTTNPLFLNFPKAKLDIVINLDNEKIDFPSEKLNNTQQANLVKLCRQHTTYEKKMLT
jgi:Transport protein Avl9